MESEKRRAWLVASRGLLWGRGQAAGAGAAAGARPRAAHEDREQPGSAVAALSRSGPLQELRLGQSGFLSLCAVTANTLMECLLSPHLYVLDGVLALSPCVQ